MFLFYPKAVVGAVSLYSPLSTQAPGACISSEVKLKAKEMGFSPQLIDKACGHLSQRSKPISTFKRIPCVCGWYWRAWMELHICIYIIFYFRWNKRARYSRIGGWTFKTPWKITVIQCFNWYIAFIWEQCYFRFTFANHDVFKLYQMCSIKQIAIFEYVLILLFFYGYRICFIYLSTVL